MKRFIKDLKKYWRFIIYQTKADIKMEVVNSHLGALWIILEPLCFMLIYTFVAGTIFRTRTEYFPVFVYTGLACWNFFSKTVYSSVRLVSYYRDIVTKVYIPKYILLIEKMFVNLFKMFIAVSLVAIFMIFYKVPISFNVLFFIPIVVVLMVVTFGISSILMHFGVFVEDLANIVNIGMKFVFYLSGIFYSVSSRIPAPYNGILMYCNPMAYLINAARDCLLFTTTPSVVTMLAWLVIGICLSMIGIKTIYKYENTYVKVMRS